MAVKVNQSVIFGVKTYLEMDGSPKANLLNALSYLRSWLGPDSWIGFYIYNKETKILDLSLFQGTPACLKIRPDRGVVGACFSQKKDIYVPDVRQFPGYIACDAKSASESVFYLTDAAGRVAIFDIDSPILDGLKKKNAELTEIAALFKPYLENLF